MGGRADLPRAPDRPIDESFKYKAEQREPARRSARAQDDDVRRAIIVRIWHEHRQVYGSRHVWRQMRREGFRVARCRVRRLMRQLGLAGAVRGRARPTTTQSAPTAHQPQDRVDRHCSVTRPNQLWVSDFTYVAIWRGFVYIAFVIDVIARRIVGWRVWPSLATDFVLDALEQTIYDHGEPTTNGLVHHGDRGMQYLSMRYTDRLAEAGIAPSVGSRGDSYEKRSPNQ